MKPAQASPWKAEATLLETTARGGFSCGDPAYLRVRITGFVKENGTDVAIVTPIEKDGRDCDCPERREAYFVPLKHLVRVSAIYV